MQAGKIKFSGLYLFTFMSKVNCMMKPKIIVRTKDVDTGACEPVAVMS